jgi:hypothetical protein
MNKNDIKIARVIDVTDDNVHEALRIIKVYETVEGFTIYVKRFDSSKKVDL